MANVLVIGSGGREHCLSWKLAQSGRVAKVCVCPGNGGTVSGKIENVALAVAKPFNEIVRFCKETDIDLVVVGPEQPLVEGIVDVLGAQGIRVFGPTAKAAEIEGSKAFSKMFFHKYNVPTAQFRVFTKGQLSEAVEWTRTCGFPVVVKASGLCAGKGVLIPESAQETEEALRSMLQDSQFGDACDEVVVEQRLEGREVSIFGICDGNDFVTMVPAMDHKRAGEGDTGLNTGGMGALAPVAVPAEVLEEIKAKVFAPTIEGFRQEGSPFTGVLYAGLMVDTDGRNPYILEYNCRFGDPETQVVLPLLKNDLYEVLTAATDGVLKKAFPDGLTFRQDYCVTVVMTAAGYPESYPKGMEMFLPSSLPEDKVLFHAGTTQRDGKVVTSGGRVIACSAFGPTLAQATAEAYKLVDEVKFDKSYFRKDIAQTKNAR